MLKVVLPLLFAAFALTSALPVRNRFFEDVDDYKRDFVPKKTSDFYETAYDEYLRRRQPALSESLLEDYEDYPALAAKRIFKDYSYQDEPEKEEFSDDELLSRAFLPEEDDKAFDKSDEDYPLEDPAPWNPMDESIVGVDEYFPKYSNDEEVDEWLSNEQIPWTTEDEQEDDEEETFDAPEEKVDDEDDDEFDLVEDADMAEEGGMAEEEPNDAKEHESDEEFEEDEPADVNVEKAEDIAKVSHQTAEDAVDEAKEAIVKVESEEDEPEEVADEEDEGEQADEPEEESQEEDEAANTTEEEDEVDDMLQDEDETEEDEAAEEDEEEDEVDDMLQAQDETEEDNASEEDKEVDEAEEEDESEEDDEANDMLEDNEMEAMIEYEDAANEKPIQQEYADDEEDDETEKDAGELWKEDADEDDAEVRAILSRYRDFPSERKMVEDHNKLERELEYFQNYGFPSDDETYEFDK